MTSWLRKALQLVLLVSLIPATFGRLVAEAASVTPSTGAWGWCTVGVVDGCIESATISSSGGESSVVSSAESMPTGFSVGVGCIRGSATSCLSKRFTADNSSHCTVSPSWDGGSIPNLRVSFSGPNGSSVKLRISTGDFEPFFSLGNGITATRTSSDGDGTFTFEVTLTSETLQNADPPEEVLRGGGQAVTAWLETAEATSTWTGARIQVWPRDHMIISGLLDTPLAQYGCFYYPFAGAWAEANASAFNWGYGGAAVDIQITNGKVGIVKFQTSTALQFKANGPHFKMREGASPLEINSARVRVFMPTSFFLSLGYSSIGDVDNTSYNVATEDGQQASPSFQKRDDGILLDLGIAHYSSPNPTVTFKKVTVLTEPSRTRNIKRRQSVVLSQLISYNGTGIRRWSVTGGCSVVQGRLVTPNKKAKCLLSLKVYPKNSHTPKYARNLNISVA